jgi:hypothetical protein
MLVRAALREAVAPSVGEGALAITMAGPAISATAVRRPPVRAASQDEAAPRATGAPLAKPSRVVAEAAGRARV